MMCPKNIDASAQDVNISKTLLTRFQVNPKYFYSRLVFRDGTYVYYFEPE